MQFRVGQKVRVIGGPCMGSAGVVHGQESYFCGFRMIAEWGVTLDAPVDNETRWWFAPYLLTPLTDPKADEFIASVKSWGPLQPQTITAQLEESLLMVRGGSQ